MKEAKKRPGKLGGYNDRANVNAILAELKNIEDHTSQLKPMITKWGNLDAKNHWIEILSSLWRIEQIASAFRMGMRGDTGPLERLIDGNSNT